MEGLHSATNLQSIHPIVEDRGRPVVRDLCSAHHNHDSFLIEYPCQSIPRKVSGFDDDLAIQVRAFRWDSSGRHQAPAKLPRVTVPADDIHTARMDSGIAFEPTRYLFAGNITRLRCDELIESNVPEKQEVALGDPEAVIVEREVP